MYKIINYESNTKCYRYESVLIDKHQRYKVYNFIDYSLCFQNEYQILDKTTIPKDLCDYILSFLYEPEKYKLL